jgi:ribosomal protein L31E
MVKKTKEQKKKTISEVSRDYTINLHKRLHKVTFKRKAVTAVKKIVEFAKKNMLTDVIISQTIFRFLLKTLNNAIS